MAAIQLKTAFRKVRSITPLHTEGPIALSSNGKSLATCVAEEVALTYVETGIEQCRFVGDSTPITSLAMNLAGTQLAVFYTSMSLRIYDIPIVPPSTSVSATRHVARSHEAPVHVCIIDASSSYLASGAADGIVKVWDIRRGYVTHAFKGHGGVVSALAFHIMPETGKMNLFTGSVDNLIRIFDLTTSSSRGGSTKPQFTLDGHVSVPRALSVSADGQWLLSGGRDSVVLLWNLSGPSSDKRKGKSKNTEHVPTLAKTIPILERVEAAGIIEEEGIDSSIQLKFYTGGEKGVVRIWDAWKGKCLSTLGEELVVQHQEQREILDICYLPALSTVVSLHADQNILFYDLSTTLLSRQLIGFNDEITDAVFLSPSYDIPDSHLAIATNSSLIRVYSTSNYDARLLSGHSDMVLCIDQGCAGRLLASGSKDTSAKLWVSNPNSPGEWRCVADCEGHAGSIGAVALSRRGGVDGESPKFIFTGSQDRTIKMWDLSSVPLAHSPTTTITRLKSLTTHKAHEKDINSLDVAATDRFLATGSQDKTVKVFAIEYVASSKSGVTGEIKLVGTCKGHKRGVWNVKFSPTERVLASASGDKSVKLWNLDDFSCIKTFEGHTNSVLRVGFMSGGMQLMTAASDGLVKLWNVKDEQCVATMDNHTNKVWALAFASDDKVVVSAGADSVINFWQDCTEEEKIERDTKRAEIVLREQDFSNFLALRDYRNAILLALAMDQPGRLLSLFTSVSTSRVTDEAEPSITGSTVVDAVIRTLSGPDLARLLRHVRTWNTSAKTSPVGQTVLHAILKLRRADDIRAAFNSSLAVLDVAAGEQSSDSRKPPSTEKSPSLRDVIDALIPYTERHLARADRMVQESYVVDYILGEMDGLLGDADMEIDTIRV